MSKVAGSPADGEKVRFAVYGVLRQFNPFGPVCATFLVEVCNPITRQAIELESCSNPLRIQQVF